MSMKYFFMVDDFLFVKASSNDFFLVQQIPENKFKSFLYELYPTNIIQKFSAHLDKNQIITDKKKNHNLFYS